MVDKEGVFSSIVGGGFYSWHPLAINEDGGQTDQFLFLRHKK
jgi:hypothetical protein